MPRVLECCGFKHTPLWIQRSKMIVMWIYTLTLLEEQRLCIQATVFRCSYIKAVSHLIKTLTIRIGHLVKSSIISFESFPC